MSPVSKPVVKLVADIPPEIKAKAIRIAQQREISVKQLIVQLIKDIHEEGETKKAKEKP